MRNPERHHNKYHRDTGQPFDTCWLCARDRAVCRTKIRFTTWEEANEWVDDYNLNREWEPPHMTRYPCRWCDGWHMKTARDPRSRARMEKQRRKWLVEQGRDRG